jgi:hypothetical protein
MLVDQGEKMVGFAEDARGVLVGPKRTAPTKNAGRKKRLGS